MRCWSLQPSGAWGAAYAFYLFMKITNLCLGESLSGTQLSSHISGFIAAFELLKQNSKQRICRKMFPPHPHCSCHPCPQCFPLGGPRNQERLLWKSRDSKALPFGLHFLPCRGRAGTERSWPWPWPWRADTEGPAGDAAPQQGASWELLL